MSADPRHQVIMTALEEASNTFLQMRATTGISDYWRHSNVIRRNQLVARARDTILSNWHPDAVPGTPAWNQHYNGLSTWARETLRVIIDRHMNSGDSPAASDNEGHLRIAKKSSKHRRPRDDGDDGVFNMSP